MIKGARRSIIVLKTPSGKYFEQAYFIVKDGIDSRKDQKKDMVKEAYKIANEALLNGEEISESDKKQAGKHLLFFALGMFTCSLICVALLLLTI